MSNWLGIHGSDLPPLLFAFFVSTAGMIVALAFGFLSNWRRVRISEHQAALKQSMVEKGMSPTDIERVLAAGLPPH